MNLTITFLLLIFVFTVISLLTNIFIFGKYRKTLYVLIPLQLGLASLGYYAIEQSKGYATHSITELYQEFVYVHHFTSENLIYLLAIPENAAEPRLYVFDYKNDQVAKGRMQRKMQMGKDMLESGWKARGVLNQDDEPTFRVKNYLKEFPKDEEHN